MNTNRYAWHHLWRLGFFLLVGCAFYGIGSQRDLDCSYSYGIREYNQDMSKVYRDLGWFSQARHDFASAIKSYTNALEKNPYYLECYDYLGICFELCKQFDKAIQTYLKAVSLSPDFIQMRKQKRKTIPSLDPINQPSIPGKIAWNGESLTHKTLLVKSVGGIGDSVFFMRFILMIAQQAEHVLFVPPAELYALCKDTFNERVTVLPPDVAADAIECDFYTWLHMIPSFLSLSYDKIPLREGYLDAVTGDKALGDKVIGVMLPSLEDGAVDQIKHVWHRLALRVRRAGVRLVVLCNDANQLSAIGELAGRDCLVRDICQASVSQVAALIQGFSLFITAQTDFAHLAGAMGKPTWVLLPYVSEWHWLGYGEGEESCWYASVKKFRQTKKHDWVGVLTSVCARLEKQRELCACLKK